jgi:hypothetical protein
MPCVGLTAMAHCVALVVSAGFGNSLVACNDRETLDMKRKIKISFGLVVVTTLVVAGGRILIPGVSDEEARGATLSDEHLASIHGGADGCKALHFSIEDEDFYECEHPNTYPDPTTCNTDYLGMGSSPENCIVNDYTGSACTWGEFTLCITVPCATEDQDGVGDPPVIPPKLKQLLVDNDGADCDAGSSSWYNTFTFGAGGCAHASCEGYNEYSACLTSSCSGIILHTADKLGNAQDICG